jgi:ubiquinone/menaquinone biosynthesis C-methylase UbiE
LTLPLAANGYIVTAVEPNNAMRTHGMKRTAALSNVTWINATGEATGLPENLFDFVSFGSSFNVMDRQNALRETYRLLRPKGYFSCMWNHRNLEDPIQKSIEKIIAGFIPQYHYGSRREDQTDEIGKSGLFTDLEFVSGEIVHSQTATQIVEAWRSHATLHRQAKATFPEIMRAISAYLNTVSTGMLAIPYTTRAWIARRKD